jgi:hypothetical protein
MPVTTQEALNYIVGTTVTTHSNPQFATISAAHRIGELVTNKYIAQEFSPAVPLHAAVSIRRGTNAGTYTGDITVSLQTATGSPAVPDGVNIATATIPNATWNAGAVDAQVTVALPAVLKMDGTNYFYVVMSSTVDPVNYTRITTGPVGNADTVYAGHRLAISEDTSSWTTVQADLAFATRFGGLGGLGLLPIQDCLNLINGTTGATSQDAYNTWAGTTGRTSQDAINVKAGTTGLRKQDAASIIAGL